MNVQTTLDWVEAQTGIAGPSMCKRVGHVWECIDDAPRVVHGKEAGWHECTRCGAHRFLWLATGDTEPEDLDP